MSFRFYFLSVLSLLALLTTAVLLMNWLVDPLDVFRVVRKDGFNSVKSSYIPYARLAKPSQIERGHYSRLAIGSSRMLMGIPVRNEAWATAAGDRGFNAGIQGADLRQIRQLFEHAVVVGGVKSVLIDLDIFMFNVWVPSGQYPYALAAFSETKTEKFVRERDTALNLLFSPSITLASIQTLRRQGPKHNKVMIDGTVNHENEQRRALKDGYEILFRQYEEGMLRTGWSPCSDNRYAFSKADADPEKYINKLKYFQEILQIAKEHHVDMTFFISPVHVRLLEVQHAAGLWGDAEAMKRELVSSIADVYGENPEGVALWDFSGYHSYAQENVPQQIGTPMQWHLDSSHFSQALGHKMLNKMFSSFDSEPGFGVQLRPDNIESVLQDERNRQAAFQMSHAELSRDMQQRTAVVLQDKKRNGIVCK